ncbi:thiolase domain-containing protein [candidate division KSB1 bacterium]|nr:thiolase domain-containing protein [candidate division KSB1 bacterium]MBL7095680.1 thiolase domain-containing protein [candidate division KSB1 bacterium]
MREVAIIGIGMMKWGELWEKSIRDLCVEAALNCLKDAGTDRVDSITVGTMSSGLFTGQEHLASIVPDYLGTKNAPAMRVESACASGGLAVKSGFMEVASGLSDFVLAVGVEKMTDVSGGEATYALATAADQEWEGFHGVTFPGLYAMMALAHMEKYGTTREQLADVAVKNHFNGSMNSHAQFPMKVTREQVMNSVMVADPIRILDCSPITDGAAAVLLTTVEEAQKITNHPLTVISGIGHATDTIALSQRSDLYSLKAVEIATERALKMAGKTIENIDFAEVHDCFTIAEIMVMEAMGVVKPGQGGPATSDGFSSLEGSFPINPSGGLKSKGHPVGATGVAQIVEAVNQLRGLSENRQIKNAKTALTQNMGGSGGSSVVHILEVK